MKFFLLLIFFLSAVPSFADRRTYVVQPTAGQLFFSVKNATDAESLGLKGRVKSYRSEGIFYYLFDEKGNFKHVDIGDDSYAYQSVYDEHGNQTEVRKMQLNPNIKTWVEQYTYDKKNRVLEEIHFSDGGSVVEYYHYFYDKAGHLVKEEQLGNGNSKEQLVSKKYKLSPNCSVPLNGASVVEYDSVGAVKCTKFNQENGYKYVYADSIVSVNSYQNVEKVVELLKDGKITTKMTYMNDSILDKSEYIYSNEGLLTSITGLYYQTTFEYDAVGNLVRMHKSFFESKKEETVIYSIEYY